MVLLKSPVPRMLHGGPASSKIIHSKFLGVVAAVFALLTGGAVRITAQTSPPSSNSCLESSFEFPQWSDTSWKSANAYSSIQLADIDGDGQDELIGDGPDGVEIWHWEPHGQAWIRMNAGTPTLASTDVLMTADVDGDGQAEIIQITPNLNFNPANPVLNVWHFDTSVAIWRLEPQLRLTLTPSSTLTANQSIPIASTITFAKMQRSGGKQQQLVNLVRTANYAGSPTNYNYFYTPLVYQVNAAQTGWSRVAEGTRVLAGPNSTSSPSYMQVGDVTGDGLADIVILLQNGSFLIFNQQAAPSGGFSLAPGSQVTLPNYGRDIYNFTLADTLGAGYDQIYVIDHAFLSGFQFTPQGLQLIGFSQPEDSSVSPVYGTLRTVNINAPNATDPKQGAPILPSGQSVLMLDGNGLEQFSAHGPVNPSAFSSNSPAVTVGRFGDDPSHYRTIQSGTVYAYSSAQTPVQYSETIVIARDANGMHTLVPTPAGNLCGSRTAAVPGFDFPRKDPGDRGYVWFPNIFPTSGQQLAYNCFGYITGNPNDVYAAFATSKNLSTLLNTVSSATYPPPSSCGTPPNFSQDDFTAVQNTLKSQINEAIGVKAWLDTNVKYSLQDINTKESAKLTQAVSDLALPSDATAFDGGSAAGIAYQVISSVFEFLNYAADTADAPAYGVISEAVSVAGDIISDAEAFETSPGGTLTQKGSSLSSELTTSYADQLTALANEEDKVTGNWDLLDQFYQQIQSPSFQRFSSSQLDSSANAAATKYGVWAWQQLMPSVWSIYGQPASSTSDPTYLLYLSNYPTQYVVRAPISWSFGCGLLPYPGLSAFIYLSVPTNKNYPPASVNAIQDLTDPVNGLGVNLYDVLGQRNGWQNVSIADAGLFRSCYPGNIWTIPAVNPYYNPPPPPAASYGAPAKLVISGGQATGRLQPSCNGNQPDLLQQSAPINSVFPVPITVTVEDASNAGVPNATVQITGRGLSRIPISVMTDVNGDATVNLLANNIIEAPYQATFSVVSPALDPSAPACQLTQPYLLQNTAPVSGTTPTNPDIRANVSVQSKGAIFTTDRRWNLLVTDPTGTATGGTISGTLTHTRGPSTCSPVPVVSDNLHPSGAPGQFTSTIGWDFSSCTGLNLFTLTVNGLFTIPLDDGTSYQSSYSASTNSQTP